MKKLFILILSLSSIIVAYAQNDSSLLKGRGVIYYDSTLTQTGVNLIQYSDTKSFLMDMHGNILKRIPLGYANFLSDGTIIGMADDTVLLRMDGDFNIIWKKSVNGGIHHCIFIDEKNKIYLLSGAPHIFLGSTMRFDVIKIYSENGDLIYTWDSFLHLNEIMSIISKSAWCNDLPLPFDSTTISIEKYVSQNPVRFMVPAAVGLNFWVPELTHFNFIYALPENKIAASIPAFKKGNLLLSFNPYSSCVILNPTTDKIEWVGYLPERTSLHSPILTPDGTILIFQNSTDSIGWMPPGRWAKLCRFLNDKSLPAYLFDSKKERRWASITEYDPLDFKKVWEYTANPKESLIARARGNVNRLLNGNTLITIDPDFEDGITRSRVIEVTPDKKIVWDYISSEFDNQGNNMEPISGAFRLNTSLVQKVFPGFKQ